MNCAAGSEKRFELGRTLHGQMELVSTPLYGRFLKVMFPVIVQLLQQIPQQQPGTPEHKLRRLLVEVLTRLPQNETIRPYVPDLLRLTLRVITSDNEENTLICMHIFSDVLRTHKPSDIDAAVMFLDFVKGVRMHYMHDLVTILLVILILVMPYGLPPPSMQLSDTCKVSTPVCSTVV